MRRPNVLVRADTAGLEKGRVVGRVRAERCTRGLVVPGRTEGSIAAVIAAALTAAGCAAVLTACAAVSPPSGCSGTQKS